jgi:tRNA(adenine34) deaminase
MESKEALDRRMMGRCVELARTALSIGEYPYAAVIALDGKLVAEATNRAVRDHDLSRHAEIVAIVEAGKSLARDSLSPTTLYSLVEPCAMCAYCIREAGIGRVVFALGSPVMGGLSRWNILGDEGIGARIPFIFGAAPEIVEGVLAEEARQVWRDWSPVAWRMVQLRGLLVDPRSKDGQIETRAGQQRSFWERVRRGFGHPRPPRRPHKRENSGS